MTGCSDSPQSKVRRIPLLDRQPNLLIFPEVDQFVGLFDIGETGFEPGPPGPAVPERVKVRSASSVAPEGPTVPCFEAVAGPSPT
jgi:hypothetical protein